MQTRSWTYRFGLAVVVVAALVVVTGRQVHLSEGRGDTLFNRSFAQMLLVDPYPRTLDQIFSPETRARLEALAPVTWHDGPPAGARARRGAPAGADCDRRPDRAARRAARARHRACAPCSTSRATSSRTSTTPPASRGGSRCSGSARSSASRSPSSRSGWRSPPRGTSRAATPRCAQEPRRMFDEGRNGGAFLLAGKTVGPRRLRQPRPRAAAAAAAVRLPAARRTIPWLPRRRLAALGIEPVGLLELFARSASCSCSRPRRPRTPARSAASASRRWRRLGGRARLAGRGRRLGRAARRRGVRPHPGGNRRLPGRADSRGERARATPGTILSAHRAGNVPEIWRRSARWSRTISRRSLAGRHRSGCSGPTRSTVDRLRSRPIG